MEDGINGETRYRIPRNQLFGPAPLSPDLTTLKEKLYMQTVF